MIPLGNSEDEIVLNDIFDKKTRDSFKIELSKLSTLKENKNTPIDFSQDFNFKKNNQKVEQIHYGQQKVIAKIKQATWDDYEIIMAKAQEAFKVWRKVPAPKRGEIVRQMGDELRKYKEPLGKLVSYEMGKVYQEGLGEVQEMIDICDFAVGQSRMLYGMTTHSERPDHRMFEQYHPLGIVGVVSAFNFPIFFTISLVISTHIPLLCFSISKTSLPCMSYILIKKPSSSASIARLAIYPSSI